MIRYTEYAKRRVWRRKIPLGLVDRVLREPEQLIEERGRKVAQSRWTMPAGEDHLLRAVYEESGTDILVVTVYDTSRVRKYWRTT